MVSRTNQFGEIEHLTIVPMFLLETTQGQVDEGKVLSFMDNMPTAFPTGARYGRADGMIKLRDGHHRIEAEKRLGHDYVMMWVADQSSNDGLSKALSEDSEEYISAPAIKTSTGRVFSGGKSHAHVIGIMKEAVAKRELHPLELIHAMGDYKNKFGYVTNKDKFLNRKDAYSLAVDKGQTKYGTLRGEASDELESGNVNFKKSLSVQGPEHVPEEGMRLGVDPTKETTYKYSFEHLPTGRKGIVTLSVPHKDNTDRWAKIRGISLSVLPTDKASVLAHGDSTNQYRSHLPHKDIVALGKHMRDNHPHVKGIATGDYHDSVLGQEEGRVIPTISHTQHS